MVVALDHGAHVAEAAYRGCVKIPHRIDDIGVVGVDDVRAAVAVSGQVDLPDAFDRNAVQKLDRIETMVERADVDIVHVQQHMAVGASRDFGQEVPFAHLGPAKRHVTRNVLEQDLAAEEILHLAHPGGDMFDRLLRIRNRKQVVQIFTGDSGPAQVIGHPGWLNPLRKPHQRLQVIVVEGVGTTDRQRHPVQHDRVVGAYAIEKIQGFAAGNEVVFGQRLEPVDARVALEYGLVMVGTQAESKAKPGIHCHEETMVFNQRGSPAARTSRT